MTNDERLSIIAKLEICQGALEYAIKWKAKQSLIMGDVLKVLGDIKSVVHNDH